VAELSAKHTHAPRERLTGVEIAAIYGRNRKKCERLGQLYGGALINQGVHTVDLLLWLMADVTLVQARASTALHKIEVEDTVVAH
jgi:predicted dehydrogenase